VWGIGGGSSQPPKAGDLEEKHPAAGGKESGGEALGDFCYFSIKIAYLRLGGKNILNILNNNSENFRG